MDVRKRANKIRANDGQKAWKKFLRNHDFQLESTSTGLNPYGVSTQGFDNVDGSSSDCDICLEFTLYVDSDGTYTIDMYWTYNSDFVESGSAPIDGLGLYFDSQYWNYAAKKLSETTYKSNNGIVSVEDDSVSDGLPFVVDDLNASDGTGYWAGLHIVPVGDYSASEREVRGQYVHTWNVETTNLNYSIGVSFPRGVTLSFDQEKNTSVKKEPTSSEGDGDTMMKLQQNDAIA